MPNTTNNTGGATAPSNIPLNRGPYVREDWEVAPTGGWLTETLSKPSRKPIPPHNPGNTEEAKAIFDALEKQVRELIDAREYDFGARERAQGYNGMDHRENMSLYKALEYFEVGFMYLHRSINLPPVVRKEIEPVDPEPYPHEGL